MNDIDDICREIVRRQNPYGLCPYGRRPTFDDLWEDAKDEMRRTVRDTLHAAKHVANT